MSVRVLETVVRRSGLALRIVDAATWRQVAGGLDVVAWPSGDPAARTPARPSRYSGIFGFRSLPGLRPYEDGSTARSEWFASPVVRPPQPFTVRIADPAGRYLTVVRSLFAPSSHVVDVPLPRSPAAPAPPGHGLVLAQLVEPGGSPAGWALVEASVGGAVWGGVSDARGMVAVPVPFASAPSAVGTPSGGPSWDVTLTVRYRPADQVRAPGTTPTDPPTFESIAAQAAALVFDGLAAGPSLVRPLTRSGPLVASSHPPPAPTTLIVQPQ